MCVIPQDFLLFYLYRVTKTWRYIKRLLISLRGTLELRRKIRMWVPWQLQYYQSFVFFLSDCSCCRCKHEPVCLCTAWRGGPTSRCCGSSAGIQLLTFKLEIWGNVDFASDWRYLWLPPLKQGVRRKNLHETFELETVETLWYFAPPRLWAVGDGGVYMRDNTFVWQN